MKEQNYKNHIRLVPMFHGVTWMAVTSCIVMSSWNLSRACNEKTDCITAIILFLLSISAGLLCWFTRAFPLKAQDRAIRAEENLRHLALTGKLLDKKITLSQTIALRFASDEEFVALAKKAAEENLSSTEIKKAIQNWRGDYHRV